MQEFSGYTMIELKGKRVRTPGSVVEETGPDRGRDLFISHRTVLFCHPNDLACPHIDHVAKA